MKNQRFWLTPQEDTGSHVVASVCEDYVSVTLADCSRRIDWEFNHRTPAGQRAALAKARKVQKFFNELVAHLEEQKPKKTRRRSGLY